MKQIVFKRKFSLLFDAVKTENVQYLEEKIQPIKKIVIKKYPVNKIVKNLDLRKSRLIFENISLRSSYSIPGISMTNLVSIGLLANA